MILSTYILAVAVAWIAAQGAKYVLATVRSGDASHFRQLYLSGGMPSAHSASVVALLVVVGGLDGVDSAVFAVAVLFAAIVMYDSMMVRRSSGEQGKALQMLLEEQKSEIPTPRVAKGHTPLEVAAGALLGLLVGLVAVLIALQ